jgi:D-alanyl-D-alanine carboxypeptidase/D-alanyl-D-alanine-endopeptidase (penicillin-binding protein 4)
VPPFDETPEFRYNVIPDAIFLDGYLLGLELDSDAARIRVSLSTPLEGVKVESAMTLIDRACDLWEDGWKLPQVQSIEGRVRIRLAGEYPRNCSTSTSISVLDRVDFADRLFRALWRELGGTFRGSTKFSPAPGGRTLARHTSRSLAELTREVSKRSDNPVTRIVYLVLGTLDSGPAGGDTAVRAEREVRAWMNEKGIDDAGLVLENGSGLSRKERIRPAQLAKVLALARSSPWAPEFIAALPIVGHDGGMRKRLNGSPALGKARIKTGTLRDVSAVAGYVDNAAGDTLIAVAMINHPLAKASVARPILDALLDSVARSGGKVAKER